jgi:hypothetical protein
MNFMKIKSSVFILLLFLSFSCTEEPGIDQDLFGVWVLSEQTVDGSSIVLSACEKLSSIELQEDNFCILFDACAGDSVFSGWNYNYEMINIAELLPAAFYIESLDAISLVIKRNDITVEGNLQETIFSYSRKN